MARAPFDPGGYFEFDLDRGAVSVRGGDRVIVMTDNVVAPLVSAAVSAGDLTAVRRLGRQMGESAAADLGGDPSALSAETVLGHAVGILSVFGWGKLGIERWGDALVARLAHIPALDDEHLGVAALLGGLFSALTSRDVACVPVSEKGVFLLVDPSVAQQVWKWSRGGETVPAIVGRLGAPS